MRVSWSEGALWWVTAALFGLGGPFVGLGAERLASRIEEEALSALCAGHVSEQAAWLARETYALAGELSHLEALFDGPTGLTREEFRRFTKPVLESHPAIQAIEWAPRIPASQRASHEQRARSEGLLDYRIRSQAPAGGLVMAPPKREYYPVFYAEPLGPNAPALGFDLSSETTRNAALTVALETRKLSLSDPVDPVQGGGDRALLALLTVDRRPVADAGAGHGQPEGVVLLVLRTRELLERALLPHEAGGGVPMEYELIDANPGGTPLVIGTVSTRDEKTPLASSVFEASLELGSQPWRLIGWPTQAFVSEHVTRWPLALGIGVFLFWETAGGLALLLQKRRKDAVFRRQARTYEAAVRSLTEGVVVADAAGEFVLFNPAAERILGMGLEEVGLQEWSRTYGCFYPDARTPFPPEQLPLARALKGEEAEEELFIRNQRVPDGVWISVSGAPMRNERGVLEGGAVVFRDITASKKASEERLRLSNALEQTADSVFITNREGVIEYVNPAFEATTGYSSEEALGQTPRILKSGKSSPQHYEELWRTILAGETFRSQIVNRRKSGELYHAEQSITPVRTSDGTVTHFVSVVKDVTDRVKRQAQEIEMLYASQIQKKLYPAEAPQIDGYDIAGAVFPAQATCGDYFDYVPFADHDFGLVIGDVSGHGLGPALIMAATRSYLRFLSTWCSDPAEIFETISNALFADLELNHYVAMVLVKLDACSGRFTFANAGHLSGYHLDHEGAVKTVLCSTGVPLGAFANQKYGCSEGVTIESGDVVVLFTDGIPEVEDGTGNFLGTENVLNVIRAHNHEPAERIVQHLYRAARDFAGGDPQQDDITVVVCRALSRAANS